MIQESRLTSKASIPIAIVKGVAVATIQGELSRDMIARFRTELLELLPRKRTTAVVIDLSSVDYMDASEFEALLSTVRMAELMGAEVVVSGIQPAIAGALVELDVEVDAVRAALTLDHAMELLVRNSAQSDGDSDIAISMDAEAVSSDDDLRSDDR